MSLTASAGSHLQLPRRESGWADLFWPAFRRSKNPMLLLDERRRVLEVNGPSLQLLGYARGRLIGRPVYEFVAGGPVLSPAQWRAAVVQPRFNGVAHLVCAEGRRVTAEFAGHAALVGGRRIVLVVAIATARTGRRLASESRDHVSTGELTRRECEVVRLLALGAEGPEIAAELHLTHNTVRTHVRNAMRKLGARSRAQLVAIALASGEGLAGAEDLVGGEAQADADTP